MIKIHKHTLMLILSASMSQAAVTQFILTGNGGTGLLGSNENPVVSGGGSGGEVNTGVSYDDVTMMLSINIGWGSGMGFTDITGDITALHIHDSGVANGFSNNGGVLVGLNMLPGFTASGTNGGFIGTVTLTSAQELALLNNQTYINGHSSANPGGEIRGHLVQVVPEPSSTALLGLGTLAFILKRRR